MRVKSNFFSFGKCFYNRRTRFVCTLKLCKWMSPICLIYMYTYVQVGFTHSILLSQWWTLGREGKGRMPHKREADVVKWNQLRWLHGTCVTERWWLCEEMHVVWVWKGEEVREWHGIRWWGGTCHERSWIEEEDAQEHGEWGNCCGELPANPCVSGENCCKMCVPHNIT